ncbi:MAG: fibronectin type III domain-containing protein [Lachnospiraceae bacterium]|nr:fibronectin type III domain-containing protein [Lachnospiraceae bacterium]
MQKKLRSLLLVLCVCLVSLFAPATVFAETEGETTLTIRIGGKTYENVTNGSTIIGDFDLKDLDFWVESVNGNKLKNVGSKSTAKDSQGRNPLEIASVPGKGRVAVTLTYHAEDDPVAANQAYGFSVAGITFANSQSSTVTVPKVGKVSGLKAAAQSKALKLTWKKNSSISGYEVQYSTSKSFASAKTVKVSKSKTGYTIKKLKGSKKYYIRIRAYKNYTDELGQKVTAEGKWSSAVSKTTKK